MFSTNANRTSSPCVTVALSRIKTREFSLWWSPVEYQPLCTVPQVWVNSSRVSQCGMRCENISQSFDVNKFATVHGKAERGSISLPFCLYSLNTACIQPSFSILLFTMFTVHVQTMPIWSRFLTCCVPLKSSFLILSVLVAPKEKRIDCP